MKFLLSIAFVAIFLSAITLQQVRSTFKKANKSKENATAFHSLMQKDISIKKELKNAYLGASIIIISPYQPSIAEKIKVFKKGTSILDKAVLAAPKNVEVRLVRLVLQNEVPEFLNYNGNIEKDKAFILENLSSTSKEIVQLVKNINSDLHLFTQQELRE